MVDSNALLEESGCLILKYKRISALKGLARPGTGAKLTLDLCEFESPPLDRPPANPPAPPPPPLFPPLDDVDVVAPVASASPAATVITIRPSPPNPRPPPALPPPDPDAVELDRWRGAKRLFNWTSAGPRVEEDERLLLAIPPLS
jgi:hypothetical protein